MLIVLFHYSKFRISYQATDEWKATRAAELLVPQYVVRIETTASK